MTDPPYNRGEDRALEALMRLAAACTTVDQSKLPKQYREGFQNALSNAIKVIRNG